MPPPSSLFLCPLSSRARIIIRPPLLIFRIRAAVLFLQARGRQISRRQRLPERRVILFRITVRLLSRHLFTDDYELLCLLCAY